MFVVVVERDEADPSLWRYGKADREGRLCGDVRRLRYDPAIGAGAPVDPPGPDHPTAVLLVRQAAESTRRLDWDVGAAMFPQSGSDPEPPPPAERGWTRATAGKAKGAGETLTQRASRQRPQPRAAA